MSETSPRPAIDAVLPIIVDGGGGQDLFRAALQARALRKFFDRNDLLRVNVVARSEEIGVIQDALQPFAAPWLQYRFWDERDALAGVADAEIDGWHKQQIIKMAAPEWLGAPLWLTLDADVICTKPVGVADLVPGGRALMQCDVLEDIPSFENWTWAVRYLMGLLGPPLSLGMSITPLIYVAPIMREAHAMIEAAHGRPWKDVLASEELAAEMARRGGQSWTENLLYFTAAVRSGLLRQYHAISGIDSLQRIYSDGIWSAEAWRDWKVERAFDRTAPGFFEVCSSYTGMPVEFIAEKIAPFLDAPEETADAVRSDVVAGLYDEYDEVQDTDPRLRVRILSRDPLIVQGPYDLGISSVVSRAALQPFWDRPAIVIVTLSYSHEDIRRARQVAARLARRKRDAPLHRFVLLCNSELELQNFRELGVDCALVSHNVLINEQPFMVEEPAQVEFDAVYNAAFHPMKRHHLAMEIQSLALIYAHWHDDPRFASYAASAREVLSHATFINQPTPQDEYQFFSHDEMALHLSRARVGLSLSEVEGSHRASLEYLYLGLPVVATWNQGGRDELFDADFCAIVPPTADFIAGAVRELVARRLPRKYVRRRTLAKVATHRERYVETVRRAIAAMGFQNVPHIVWPWLDREVYAFPTIEDMLAGLR